MTDPLSRFARLGQRLFNRPLMVHPAKAEMVVAALADRLGVIRLDAAPPEAALTAEHPGAPRADGRPYDVIEGVAAIEVSGLLVQKSGALQPICGMTGYDGLRVNLLTALADPEVKGIWLDVDSCGGEVAGCFDLVDTIAAARAAKPIWAMLDEVGYSAAYAIASAADRVILPRTGGAGSIGVVTMHVDLSKAMARDGLAVTMIHFGERKVDGNEYQPLGAEALQRIQAEIDRIGEIFVGTVAGNRRLAANAVRAQQAATFHGADAVTNGLADAVMAPHEAFAEFLELLGP